MAVQRMIFATVLTIVTVVSFIIGYIVLAWPLAYITDSLNDAWPTDPNMTSVVGSRMEIYNSEVMLNYFLAAAFIAGIVLCFVWYWTYAHKQEYEQD